MNNWLECGNRLGVAQTRRAVPRVPPRSVTFIKALTRYIFYPHLWGGGTTQWWVRLITNIAEFLPHPSLTLFVPPVSPAGSGTSGSDNPPECHSIPSVSLRYPEGKVVRRSTIALMRHKPVGRGLASRRKATPTTRHQKRHKPTTLPFGEGGPRSGG